MARGIVIGLVLGLAATQARGLTWEEARQAAMTGNADYRTAELSVEKAGYDVTSARAGFMPRVTVNAGRTMVREEPVNPALPDHTISNSASVTASQGLFSGGRDVAKTAAAQANRESSVAGRDKVSVDVRTTLKKAFDDAVMLDQLVKLNRNAAERRATNVRITTLRYDGGREHKGSVLKTEAAAMQARADVGEAEDNLRQAKAELGVLIGRNISDSESVIGTLPDKTTPAAATAAKKSLPPEVREARAKVDAAAASVRVARSAFYGEVSLDASAGRTGEDLATDKTRTTVGISASIPVFNASNFPAVRSAAVDRTQAEIAARDAESRFRLKQLQASSNLTDSRARLAAADKMLEAARVLADVSRQRYTLGLVSFADWDQAETELITAERSALKARSDIAVALADMDAAGGALLEDKR